MHYAARGRAKVILNMMDPLQPVSSDEQTPGVETFSSSFALKETLISCGPNNYAA
jgi:hypothetical protein